MSKFLIVRFSSIGDIVLTTPVIRCLKKQVPGAEVHFLTKRSFASVLIDNPYIDKLYFLEDNLFDIVHQLRQEKYHAIIDLQHNQRSLRLKTLLGVKSFSFHKLNIEKWLLVNFHINKLPHVHIVDRYLDTVKSLGVENDGMGLDYFIPVEAEKCLSTLPPAFQNNYLAFVIGAKHFTKQLPADKIVRICNLIKSPLVLLGGPEDKEKGALIAGQCDSKVFDATGKYSLSESAALVKHAKKIITHDTGLMHIAAAFKKDILSVWGNTVPEFGMTPYMDTAESFSSIIFEQADLSCRPCSKIGFSRCPKKHFKCMVNQDEKAIADWANLP